MTLERGQCWFHRYAYDFLSGRALVKHAGHRPRGSQRHEPGSPQACPPRCRQPRGGAVRPPPPASQPRAHARRTHDTPGCQEAGRLTNRVCAHVSRRSCWPQTSRIMPRCVRQASSISGADPSTIDRQTSGHHHGRQSSHDARCAMRDAMRPAELTSMRSREPGGARLFSGSSPPGMRPPAGPSVDRVSTGTE